MIVLPGKRYSLAAIAAIVVRRRWYLLLPFAAGLTATPGTDGGIISAAAPLAGLLIGLGLVAVQEYRDSTFSSEYDVARVLMLPVLGAVPRMASVRERRWRYWRMAAVAALGYFAIITALAVFLWRRLS